ncbi:MAG TPA: S8 family serine peptidase [Pseudonocardiaceae bacterium]|nr:S8 family serine peptidase [Pseudonocardiaceae bacterium]
MRAYTVGRIPVRGLRGRRRWTVAVVVITATATAAVSAVAIGQPDQPELASGLPVAGHLPAELPLGKVSPVLGTGQGSATVFVELAQTPAVDVYHAERRAGRAAPVAARAATAAKDRVSQAADRVLGTLRTLDSGTDELFRTTNAVSGLVVTADLARVREIAALPDVRSVRKMVPKTAENSNTVQLTHTLRTWQQSGRLGDGMRIGIIDDGIDYTHADFGGPGTEGAYASIDRTRIEPDFYPTAKVVGGFDFAGDDYDASGASGPDALTPRPDPNPLACGDHGTHVAGTSAGYGVNADGSTFRGDYRTLDGAALNAMRIGPGTAPKAQLYALKVFGCAGSTDVTAQAMDWTLDPNGDGDFSDRLDVVNLSLGSDYGAPDDPDSLFVRKLVQHGVLPVISAGNGGDLYDIGGSPGNTPEALTVASSRDSAVLRDGAEVTAPSDIAGAKGGQYSQDFTGYDQLDITAAVVPLSDPANKDGCQPYSGADAAAVAGEHVWLEWDDNQATRRCGSAVRADNALAAGAAGALLTSSTDQFVAGIAGNAGVPMFQFTGSDTAALRPAMQAGTLQVRLSGRLRSAVPTSYPAITDTASVFTSREVRAPAIKPDVTGPGDTIASALRGSGTDPLVISGTSMASPHIAGIAALVRQAHPDWPVEEVKAGVMNTADADIYAQEGRRGPIYGPNRVGAGRVDAAAAVRNQVLAMVQDDPGQVGVNFGVVQADTALTLGKTVKVVNKGTDPARYDLAYQPAVSTPGVEYELSADALEVAPGQVGRFTVTLRIDDPTELRRTADPTIEKIQAGAARQFLADASGRVVLTPSGDDATNQLPLRVPVYAAPKPVAAITAPRQLQFSDGGADDGGGDDERATLTLSGRGLDQGRGDAAYRSLISVLQLQAESTELPECNQIYTVDCTPNQTARGADIRYVGATSTAPLAIQQGRPDEALLAFGITTWGDWYNLGGNTIPFVDIDTTGDGEPDFEVLVTKPAGTDVLVASTVDLRAPEQPTVEMLPVNGQYGDVDTGVFDSNVVLLPVSLAALGIDPAAPTAPISYTAGIAGFYTGPADEDSVVDTAAPVQFDAVRPGLWAEGAGSPALSYLARPGEGLVVHRDPGAASLLPQESQLLVLHPLNASGDRVQLVRVRAPGRLPIPPLPGAGAAPVPDIAPVPGAAPIPDGSSGPGVPPEPTAPPAPDVQPADPPSAESPSAERVPGAREFTRSP